MTTTAAVEPLAPTPSRSRLLEEIVARIAIPAEELSVAPMPGATPPAPRVETVETTAPPTPVRSTRAPATPVQVAEVVPAGPTRAERLKAERDAKAKVEREATAKREREAKLKQQREEAAAAKKAREIPERYWVQVMTGSNVAQLGRDYAKLAKAQPALFAGRAASTAAFRDTRRLLVGPFKTNAEAASFAGRMKRAGVSGFNWTSPQGADVAALPK